MEGYECFEYLQAKYPEIQRRNWTEDWLKRMHHMGLVRAIIQGSKVEYSFCEADLSEHLLFWPKRLENSSGTSCRKPTLETKNRKQSYE